MRARSTPESSLLSLARFSVEGDGYRTPELTLDLRGGTAIWVRGGIGSGKSLVAEALCGVRRPDVRLHGEIRFPEDEDGDRRRRGLPAFVPQDPRLAVLPTDTVAGILAEAARRRLRKGEAERTRELTEELARRLSLDLERLRALDTSDLSASERRRLLLLVTLLERRPILVLDGFLEDLSDGEGARVVELLNEVRASGRALLIFSRAAPPAALPLSEEIVLAEPAPDWSVPLLPKADASWLATLSRRAPLLELDRLRVERTGRGLLRWFGREEHATIVDGLSLDLREGEVLAVVGDSGSGKSTLLETLIGYRRASSGVLRFRGRALSGARSLARLRGGAVQLVLGESEEVFEPRRTVLSVLGGNEDRARLALDRAGLPVRLLSRAQGDLSPGERQLLSLVTRLLLEPDLVLIDGPSFALDRRAFERFSALLIAEKGKGRSFLVTTNSLELAARLGDRTLMLHRGRSVELGPSERLHLSPSHPMTLALGRGELGTRQERATRGCQFVASCPRARPGDCGERDPALSLAPGGQALLEHHRVACFYPLTASERADVESPEALERRAIPPSTPPPPEAAS